MVDVVTTRTGAVETASDTPARIRLIGGGSAANTACWLADQGETPALLVGIGDDAFGVTALADLAAAGVSHVGPVLDAPTGACVVLVAPDGERTMLPDRGANDRLTSEQALAAFTAVEPGWVHLSGYTLLGAGSRAAGVAVVRRALAPPASEPPIPVSIDAASSAPLRSVGADTFLGWISGCHLVFANDDEVDALGGPEAVLVHAHELVIKHGPRGATWTDGRQQISVPGAKVEVVDTTGAGDAFAAGYIAAHRRAGTVEDSLAAGVAAGTRAVSRRGARPALDTSPSVSRRN